MSFQTAGLAFQGAGLFAFQEIDGQPVVVAAAVGGHGAARKNRYLITIDGRPLWFDTERQVKKFLRKRNRKDEPVTVIEEAPTLEAERLEAPSVEAVRKSLNRLADPVTQPVRPADDTARKRALRRRRAAAMLLLS